MNFKYPLASSSWDQNEYNAIEEVVKSGFFSMGKYVAEFESNFSQFFGAKYAIMVNSGSSANLLMIASLFFTSDNSIKLKRGDEVIVPAVSWSTTYFPLQQYGLKVKFVDINKYTLNYDLEQLSKAITDKTKAVILVNLLGNPNDFDAIKDIIDGKELILLEDNCESMGAKFSDKSTGTFGLMGTFSCFFSHHISTMEGGVVVTDNEELFHIMLCLRAHGWTRNLPNNNQITGTKSLDSFSESFNFVLPGYNLRPLELSGAIGLEQLKKLPTIIEGRRKNALFFQEKMSNSRYFDIQEEIGDSSWFGFSLILKNNVKLERKHFIEILEKNGFEVRPIVAGNFAKNKVLEYFEYEVFGNLGNADYVDKNGLFLGNQHHCLEEAISTLSNIEF